MFEKKDLIPAIGLFILFFALVYISRTNRLYTGEAITVDGVVEVFITKESTLPELIDELESTGASFDKKELEWAARLLGWRNFREGRYVITQSTDFESFLSKTGRGIQDPVSVTILPGTTYERFLQSMSSQMQLDSMDLDNYFRSEKNPFEEPFSRDKLFGRMLPETYQLYWTSSPESFVNIVLNELNNRLEGLKTRNSAIEIEEEEVITMASIIEWEAFNAKEMSTISGLYWNRLERNMLMQADPTVNFAVGERRRLLYEDYRVEHPFNTYINRGLPPAPINNPSFNAIEAAMYPENHDYLYMVASPEGGHVFNRTFQEHREASERWRTWLREQYRIKRQRESSN